MMLPVCSHPLHLCLRRLRLRSMLLPEVVNQLAALEGEASRGKGKPAPAPKTWAVAPTMFPCELSPDTLSKAKEASPCSPLHSLLPLTFAAKIYA